MGNPVPELFVGRLASQGYIDSASLLKALDEPSPISIRINLRKWQGIPPGSERVTWCDSAYYLGTRPSFTADPLFHAGCYYVQEASGLFLEKIIKKIGGGGDGLRILDVSAAPGGKATHLAALAGKGSVIIANEVIRSRAAVLSENVAKWGSGNIIVTGSDPSAFARLPGYFDIILVDAPCSGEGMFREETVRRQWSEGVCNLSALRQWRILESVWPALRQGGHLIYSTCTFNPEENEKQVARLIADKGCSLIESDFLPDAGICSITAGGQTLGYGFHPGRIRGEGLFISVVCKEEPAQCLSEGLLAAGKDSALSVRTVSIANDWYDNRSGSLKDFSGTVVAMPLPPAEFRYIASVLKVIKAGTALFTSKKEKIIPQHDLAMSAYFRRGVFPECELTAEAALRYLARRTDIDADFGSHDWIAVTFRGVVLGFVKNLGSRINNHYPASWRIVKREPEFVGVL